MAVAVYIVRGPNADSSAIPVCFTSERDAEEVVVVSGARTAGAQPIYVVRSAPGVTRVRMVGDSRALVSSFTPAAQQITYLLRDQFNTNAAAPLPSPRTCEPGPGTLTLVDTGNRLSISSNALQYTLQAGYGDPTFRGTSSLARTAGRALLARWAPTVLQDLALGWASNSALTAENNFSIALRHAANGNVDWIQNNTSATFPAVIATWAAGNTYDVAVVLRATGGFLLRKLAASTAHTLLWPVSVGTGASLFPSFMGKNSGTGSVDDFRAIDLGSPWDSDYGIADFRNASPVSGAAGTMSPDAIVEFTWTVATGETLELDIRRTDASNRWCIRCSQAGSTIKLIEINAGVETERASTAQTWTNATTYRIVVTAVGNVMTPFVDTTMKTGFTSAFNNSVTGTAVAGFATGANLVSWPRTITLPSV